MKRTSLLVFVSAAIALFLGAVNAYAGVYVGVGIGGGPGPHPFYRHDGWASRQTVVIGSPYYYYYAPPTVVYEDPPPVTVVQAAPAPVVAPPPPPAPVPDSATVVPYGFVQQGGVIKSPYSDFTIGVGGHSSGDILYDANNGKPFRVP